MQPLIGFPAPTPQWDRAVMGAPDGAALRVASKPDDWATPVFCVIGPAKCGLTYLAEAWALQFDGAFLPAAQLIRLGRKGLDALAGLHVAVDDADLAAAGRGDEALLSLINLVGSGGGRLLLTSHRPPSQWRTASADLKSRLNSLPAGEIGLLNEDTLRARLVLAAEGRYLRLSTELLNYLVPRLELAYEAVENFMDRLSDAVSEHDRAPSLPLARRVLEELETTSGSGETEG